MEYTEDNYKVKSLSKIESSTISSKGQITIPSKIRELLNANYGDKIQFEQTEQDEIIIKVIKKDSLLTLFGSMPPKGEDKPENWDVIRSKAKEERHNSKEE